MDLVDDAERDAENVLRHLGFVPRKVQETSSSTPDFEVDGDSPAYLVEVKSRIWPREIVRPPAQVDNSVTRSMMHDGAVGNWLYEARKQCGAIDGGHERLWFLWCSMESPAPREQAERVWRTLYGARDAYVASEPNRQWTVFYSRPTAFERFPEFDGAVIAVPPDRMILCLNEFSVRAGAVLSSKLVARFGELGVHPLPAAARDVRSSYVVPRALDRSDEQAVLRECQRALGEPFLQFWAVDCESINAFSAQAK
jgi:hypothetical protein